MSFRPCSAALACIAPLLLFASCGAAEGMDPPAPLRASTDASRPTLPVRDGNPPIQPLTVRGQDFLDPSGASVRFWGMNLVAAYPHDPAHAAGMARALADRGINLVRPHHVLRPSTDWVGGLASGSLTRYGEDSRTLDPLALQRFDLLNAALREQGIYLMFSAHWTRTFLPGDASILPGDDASAWSEAIAELRSWPWQRSFDPIKMLPVFDERAAMVTEETLRHILTHVNPHTGLAYGRDPQILAYECVNEFTSEYTIICGNRFPPYFERKLQARWDAHATHHGLATCDLWAPPNAQAATERSHFLRQLDAAWMARVTATIRAAGVAAPVAFSNLWRGDNHLAMEAEHAGYTENHSYADPFVAAGVDDQIRAIGRSALADKPFILGEVNQSEGERGRAEAPYRTMLPLALAAYGSLHNWSGIVWFAWNHGDIQHPVGADGWALAEGRQPALGAMVTDGVLLDHLRTASILYRRHLVATSREPITLHHPGPLIRTDYHGLMDGNRMVQPGWPALHAVRHVYGPDPHAAADAPWLRQEPPTGPLVADTGEIIKDPARKQLSLAAPGAQAFSGFLDDLPPAGLTSLGIDGQGFATVIVVADDHEPLEASARLVISRTATTMAGHEGLAPALRLSGLAPGQWWLRITRPRAVWEQPIRIEQHDDGTIALPAGAWHEAELHRTR